MSFMKSNGSNVVTLVTEKVDEKFTRVTHVTTARYEVTAWRYLSLFLILFLL